MKRDTTAAYEIGGMHPPWWCLMWLRSNWPNYEKSKSDSQNVVRMKLASAGTRLRLHTSINSIPWKIVSSTPCRWFLWRGMLSALSHACTTIEHTSQIVNTQKKTIRTLWHLAFVKSARFWLLIHWNPRFNIIYARKTNWHFPACFQRADTNPLAIACCALFHSIRDVKFTALLWLLWPPDKHAARTSWKNLHAKNSTTSDTENTIRLHRSHATLAICAFCSFIAQQPINNINAWASRRSHHMQYGSDGSRGSSNQQKKGKSVEG